MDPGRRALLTETLRDAQRFGFLGARPVDDVVEHSMSFVKALVDVDGPIVDLGSGGGVPGLVVAVAAPHRRVTLLDRRTKRTDFLARAVARLEQGGALEPGNVTVEAADVADLSARTRRDGAWFDAATARGFGPPDDTVRWGATLVRPGGLVVVSEPPVGDRWDPDVLTSLGLELIDRGAVAVFRTADASELG
jgi:16S rRNA (guanine527-N7)-methyltransferase